MAFLPFWLASVIGKLKRLYNSTTYDVFIGMRGGTRAVYMCEVVGDEVFNPMLFGMCTLTNL